MSLSARHGTDTAYFEFSYIGMTAVAKLGDPHCLLFSVGGWQSFLGRASISHRIVPKQPRPFNLLQTATSHLSHQSCASIPKGFLHIIPAESLHNNLRARLPPFQTTPFSTSSPASLLHFSSASLWILQALHCRSTPLTSLSMN